ncbi:MAG: hypothetical protein WB567_01265, partial [Terracidiphilus sp.]
RVGDHRSHLTFRAPILFLSAPPDKKGWETTDPISPSALHPFVRASGHKGWDTRKLPAHINSDNALESARVKANSKTLAVSFLAQQKGHELRAHALLE